MKRVNVETLYTVVGCLKAIESMMEKESGKKVMSDLAQKVQEVIDDETNIKRGGKNGEHLPM